MLTKKIKTPNTQRSFASPWAELDYLCAKVRYWLYRRKESIPCASLSGPSEWCAGRRANRWQGNYP